MRLDLEEQNQLQKHWRKIQLWKSCTCIVWFDSMESVLFITTFTLFSFFQWTFLVILDLNPSATHCPTLNWGFFASAVCFSFFNETLPHCHYHCSLFLSDNGISIAGDKRVLNSCLSLAGNTTITHLDLSRLPFFFLSIFQMPWCINKIDNRIESEGGKLLFDSLKTNTTLTYLDLSCMPYLLNLIVKPWNRSQGSHIWLILHFTLYISCSPVVFVHLTEGIYQITELSWRKRSWYSILWWITQHWNI